jgi:SAM-dependent methyltransferase
MSGEGSTSRHENLSMPYAAFDTVADDYDRHFTQTAAGRMQREQVWTAILDSQAQSSKPDFALDLNCGTGTDAIWLAHQGYQVLATDVSPKMVALAQTKLRAAGCAKNAQAAVLDLRHLSTVPLPTGKAPALALSNFGGLNCLSPKELAIFGKKMPELLAPGGHFVAVVMGRFCWQESLYFLLKNRWRTAFRRLRRSPVEARLDEQTTVPTWYYSPQAFCRFFPDMELKMLRPIGFWLPPSYLDGAFRRQPRLLRWLGWAERVCRRFSALAWASDHFLVCLAAKPKPT